MPVIRNVVQLEFNASPEAAFRVPILGDATKFLNGYFVIPPVVGFESDETWGQVGGSRLPVSKKTLFSRGGVVGYDEVLERRENEYWKWQVTDFREPGLFFMNRAVGEFQVTGIEPGRTLAVWTYSLHARNIWCLPFTWIFAKLFWKGMQKKAIRVMKFLAESGAPTVYR